MAASTDHSSWLPKEMIVPENYVYDLENYGVLCSNIQVYVEGGDVDTPVNLGELLPSSFLQEYRTDKHADRSNEVLKTTMPIQIGKLHEKFEPSEVQKKIYPRGVYMATIDTTGSDTLADYLADMVDYGASLLAHIVDPATERVDVVILFFHPAHANRAKYTRGAANRFETEVMFLYSDQPVDKWAHSAEKTSLGSEIYLLGEIGNAQQPFRDDVLGNEGTQDTAHWRYPVLMDHLRDIMNADWEVGYMLRESPWSQALYAASKKRMAELRADKDFAKTLEKTSTSFSRTPETQDAAGEHGIPSMDTISKMSEQERRVTQFKANREDVRSLFESVYRVEHEGVNNAVFNQRSYVNMLKKSLGKAQGSAGVVYADDKTSTELAGLENEAAKVLEKLGRVSARFAFVKGKAPKTRSGKTIDTSSMFSTMSMPKIDESTEQISAVPSRARRTSKVDQAATAHSEMNVHVVG